MEKQCTKCKEYKPYSAFSRDTRRPDGLQYNCKACFSVYKKRYTREGPARAKSVPTIGSTRKCKTCNVFKPFEEFDICPNPEAGLRTSCRDCRRGIPHACVSCKTVFNNANRMRKDSSRFYRKCVECLIRDGYFVRGWIEVTKNGELNLCIWCHNILTKENRTTAKRRGTQPINMCKSCIYRQRKDSLTGELLAKHNERIAAWRKANPDKVAAMPKSKKKYTARVKREAQLNGTFCSDRYTKTQIKRQHGNVELPISLVRAKSFQLLINRRLNNDQEN